MANGKDRKPYTQITAQLYMTAMHTIQITARKPLPFTCKPSQRLDKRNLFPKLNLQTQEALRRKPAQYAKTWNGNAINQT